MQDELWIQLSPAVQLKWLLVVQHVGAFFCGAYAFSGVYWFIVLLGLGSILSLVICLNKFVYYQSRSAVVQFSLKPDGRSVCHTRAGHVFQGVVLGSRSYRSQYCIVLAIRAKAAKTHYIPIFRGSISPFAYQRLLAHMRVI